MSGYGYKHYVRIPLAWYFPALITLKLFCVAMHFDDTTDKCGNLLSNCASLKNLTLNNCRIVGGRSKDLKICHLGLSNLTLEDGGYNYVNVDTPQLKNFTLINFPSVHLVSAPNLASLHLEDDKDKHFGHPLKVSADLLHLEKVDVCIRCSHEYKYKDYAQDIVCLLQQLYSVKCLTLNSELVKLLSSSVELISDQPSPFTRLKSLKIYPSDITEPEVTMSTEVKNFLLDSSQDATFTLVSHEVCTT
ncbi:hypothetical protein M8C21_024268 [Ambrosia artemisiifolia]|uniref:F-box/LRR-repeat protein n=1 Tax=Ambrosia artemisiifolia TaxID=4212 RepID=A0AAD5CFR8_AMBAR|nr:hypothetical protein M8C21_024268 [Ambrosia artemisiifolia]